MDACVRIEKQRVKNTREKRGSINNNHHHHRLAAPNRYLNISKQKTATDVCMRFHSKPLRMYLYYPALALVLPSIPGSVKSCSLPPPSRSLRFETSNDPCSRKQPSRQSPACSHKGRPCIFPCAEIPCAERMSSQNGHRSVGKGGQKSPPKKEEGSGASSLVSSRKNTRRRSPCIRHPPSPRQRTSVHAAAASSTCWSSLSTPLVEIDFWKHIPGTLTLVLLRSEARRRRCQWRRR